MLFLFLPGFATVRTCILKLSRQVIFTPAALIFILNEAKCWTFNYSRGKLESALESSRKFQHQIETDSFDISWIRMLLNIINFTESLSIVESPFFPSSFLKMIIVVLQPPLDIYISNE